MNLSYSQNRKRYPTKVFFVRAKVMLQIIMMSSSSDKQENLYYGHRKFTNKNQL